MDKKNHTNQDVKNKMVKLNHNNIQNKLQLHHANHLLNQLRNICIIFIVTTNLRVFFTKIIGLKKLN